MQHDFRQLVWRNIAVQRQACRGAMGKDRPVREIAIVRHAGHIGPRLPKGGNNGDSQPVALFQNQIKHDRVKGVVFQRLYLRISVTAQVDIRALTLPISSPFHVQNSTALHYKNANRHKSGMVLRQMCHDGKLPQIVAAGYLQSTLGPSMTDSCCPPLVSWAKIRLKQAKSAGKGRLIMTTWITICDTCKRDGWDLTGAEQTDGEALANLIEDAARDVPDVLTRRVACLMGCKSGCNVAVQAHGKLSYTIGNFEPLAEAAAGIVTYASLHAGSTSGQVPYRDWPSAIKGHFVTRHPPLPGATTETDAA
jgi:predicted metal-binding protein